MTRYIAKEDLYCDNAPRGWWCSRWEGHAGPCAARPRWWNWSSFARQYRKFWRKN